MKTQRHVVHLLYRFAAGGLENVIVQLVNGLPHGEFRHTIVALTEADLAFIARIARNDVEIIALHKKPGQPFALYPKMYRLLRRLRPDVLHTCNIAALEFMPVAALARVPLRIHAEHGWDIADPDGSNPRYRQLRRFYALFIHKVVAVSAQIQAYWKNTLGYPAEHLQLVTNGVDCDRFRPRQSGDSLPAGWPFSPDAHYVIGTVGRLEPIKNHHLLVESFIRLRQLPDTESLRLAIVGDGPLRESIAEKIEAAGLARYLWLPGSRADIPDILRSLDCFVLPSLAEGTSCTLQEAMATGLPIIATDVGGNADLLENGAYGSLVPSENPERLADAIRVVTCQPKQTRIAARQAVIAQYGAQALLSRYQALFSLA